MTRKKKNTKAKATVNQKKILNQTEKRADTSELISDPEPKIILFLDLVGSSEVATELPPNDYTNFYLRSFFTAGKATEKLLLSFINKYPFHPKRKIQLLKSWKKGLASQKLLGDEIFFMTDIKRLYDCPDDIILSLFYAYDFRLFWLLTPYNIAKITDQKNPRQVSIGIHIGNVYKIMGIESNQQLLSSYDINIAKRVESKSKEGKSSNIYVTNIIAEKYNKIRERNLDKYAEKPNSMLTLLESTGFDTAKGEKLKGIAGNIYVCESIPNYELENEKRRDVLIELLENIYNIGIGEFAKKDKKEPKIYTMLILFLKALEDLYKDYWKTSNFLSNEKRIKKYITNLHYLFYFSKNKWFKFNAFYITAALFEYIRRKKYYLPKKLKKLFTEMYPDLKKEIDRKITKTQIKDKKL